MLCLTWGMITKTIKERIESRFGKKIRYPKDCYSLANEIAKVCNEQISPATLMRLFGLTKNNSHPRLFTLDVIAQYCGYSTWEDFLECECIENYDLQKKDPLKLECISPILENHDDSQDKMISITINKENQLTILDTQISQLSPRTFVDALIVKNVYILILESLDKNATGKLIKVDTAKLYPM